MQDMGVIFTTRKLQIILPSLKAPVATELRSSRVVCEFRCPGSNARCVGQTDRHFSTQQKEHLETTVPVAEYLSDCE